MKLSNQWNLELTFVKKENNFLEDLHKVHVLITKLLHSDQQSQFRAWSLGKRGEERSILPQMLQRLFSHQLFFLVPLNGSHYRIPQLKRCNYKSLKIYTIKKLNFYTTEVMISCSWRLNLTTASLTEATMSLTGLLSLISSSNCFCKSFLLPWLAFKRR